MPKFCVLVIAPRPPGDVNANCVCEEILRRRPQIELVEGRLLYGFEALSFLEDVPDSIPCAVVLVGPLAETEKLALDCLNSRANAVVLRIAIIGEIVHIAARDPRLEQLIDALQQLVCSKEDLPGRRSYQLQVPAPANEPWPMLEGPPSDAARVGWDERAQETIDVDAIKEDGDDPEEPLILDDPALFEAATDWVHELLRAATGRLFKRDEGRVEITRSPIVDWLDEGRGANVPLLLNGAVAYADAELSKALDCADRSSEPLARMSRALGLDIHEFRILLLALSPELDLRHQEWISLLLDDAGARTGTLGLYEQLLGAPARVASGTTRSGRLARWRLLEGSKDVLPPADAPVRVDAPIRSWLLGDPGALELDGAIQRLIRTEPWAGASLVEDLNRALHLFIRAVDGNAWLILAGDGGPAMWRALLESAASTWGSQPIRVELGTSIGEPAENSDAGLRLARLARLTERPLLIDASRLEATAECDRALQALLDAVGRTGEVTGAIVASDSARIAKNLGAQPFLIEKDQPSAAAKAAALRHAAAAAGAHFTEEAAQSLANLYPLQIDGLERALQIALARPLGTERDAAQARFITACKMVSAEGATGLAQRIEPIFELSDVVLPADRKQQLEEIVDNIRFAPRVLEGWKFRDQLPYGLGVTALFHGPSGTGKTMASMAVAKALGVQILKIDLSRVVSKYIGETEKNIDRVFNEAQLSGAALVIDEADGLLSKRGEVKDSHDRYANLEVAYLLQRMETFEGLAILTTNLRQNLDSAFLRRLRFVIEFPRPDAAAREEIWRGCLPPASHVITDPTFKLLARRVELTGGSIRQITLRAAFLAAAAGRKIGPEHIARAADAEFAKLGLIPVELDFSQRRAAA